MWNRKQSREIAPADAQKIEEHVASSAISEEVVVDQQSLEKEQAIIEAQTPAITKLAITPEKKPEPVQLPERIFKINTKPDSFELDSEEKDFCENLLPKPIDSLKLIAQKENTDIGEMFNVVGDIRLANGITKDDKLAENSYIKIKKAYKKYATSADLPFSELGDRAFRTTGPDGTDFVISLPRETYEHDRLIVTNSFIPKGYQERAVAITAPKYTPEAFANSLKDIAFGIEFTLNTVAANSKEKVQPTEINFSITKHVDKSKENSTPENIKEEFGVERPKVSFEEIGGQQAAKHEIQSLALAFANPDIYRQYGTQPPKGVLLYGPPGTGKTLAAKVLASQAEAAFFTITPTDITSKWYGESEKHMQEIFDAAAKEERSIVYFDEIDAVTPVRDGAHEASQRVMSVILQNMDGMNSKDNVMVVAATNRLEAIDPAMRRPGRFDRIVKMDLPSKDDRLAICQIHAKKASALTERTLFDADINWGHVAAATDGLSGAELAEVVRRSLEKKARAHALTGEDQSPVSHDEFMDEVAAFRTERGTSSKPDQIAA